ncbi:MAG: hypothetical protein PHQ59_03380 [Candidatus Daviesbacteria bacterium]|nr:hypothetical protein [Candidatus Daviesbacteria bacterium]
MDQETAPKQSVKEESGVDVIEEQVVAAQPKVELQPVSNKKKIVLISLIILVFLSISIYFFVINPGGSILNMFFNKKNTSSIQPTPTPLVTNTVDVSDPQIDKDIQALNIKVTSLDTDFSNIDDGLNDNPVDNE